MNSISALGGWEIRDIFRSEMLAGFVDCKRNKILLYCTSFPSSNKCGLHIGPPYYCLKTIHIILPTSVVFQLNKNLCILFLPCLHCQFVICNKFRISIPFFTHLRLPVIYFVVCVQQQPPTAIYPFF